VASSRQCEELSLAQGPAYIDGSVSLDQSQSREPKRHLGTGPRSFRLGRRVVYRLADVRAWIEAQDHRDDA
jgi:hypothetical protein